MSNIEDRIVSILKRAPADPYTIYRKIGDCNMNELNKILSRFYRKNVINIADYKKNKRTGLDIPVYCLSSFNLSVTSFKAANFDSMVDWYHIRKSDRIQVLGQEFDYSMRSCNYLRYWYWRFRHG